MPEIRYIHAVNQALHEEMSRDENVVLLGEDVGRSGGAFGATRGLFDKFGPERVIDTPISEAAIVGLGAGAALMGLRPVVEIMFMDFITLCMDALVNQIAKVKFMTGGQYECPVVIRTPCGGGLNAGPQHSQSLEAWLAHVPGLKVVMPSTPEDAKGLLKSAIRDDSPVVVVENKALYSLKGEVPEEEYLTPIGKAIIRRTGRDVTVVATSRMVHVSLSVAEEMSKKGIDVEVIDLLTIQPWDRETVFDSVGKTHRLVIMHEAVKLFGIGAEIAAAVVEDIFDELDAPIVRVGAPYAPIPFSIEKQFLPGGEELISAIESVVG